MGLLAHKAFSLVIVVRPHNVAAALLSTGVGFSMATTGYWPWTLLAAVAIAAAAGNTINDIYDIDIDRINKPRRPLPSGAVSVRAVTARYAGLLVAAVGVRLSLPPTQAVWIAAWIVLLHCYSSFCKRFYIAGNLLVAAVSASGFLLGAYAGGSIEAGAVPAVFTFLFVMGREIVKDCDDIDGDRLAGAKTLPVLAGRCLSLRVAAAVFAALIVLFPLPSLHGVYRSGYAVVIVLSVMPILIVSLILSLRRRSLGLMSMLLKTGMFFGILAFYFGAGR